MTKPAWMTSGAVPGAAVAAAAGAAAAGRERSRSRERAPAAAPAPRYGAYDAMAMLPPGGGAGGGSWSAPAAPPAYGGAPAAWPAPAAWAPPAASAAAGSIDTKALIAAALAKTSAASAAGVNAATKSQRRLYMGNVAVASGTSEGELTAFFNAVLARAYEPGDWVVSVLYNAEKHFAFVEFKTMEIAAAALQLNGLKFKDSSLRISRPSDYNQAGPAPAVRSVVVEEEEEEENEEECTPCRRRRRLHSTASLPRSRRARPSSCAWRPSLSASTPTRRRWLPHRQDPVKPCPTRPIRLL